MLGWLFAEPLTIGTEAPDFTLPDQDGNPVTLSKLRGKNVVLVFYPADETTVCMWPQVEEKRSVVFGVNPGSAQSHKAFRARRQFPFPLLVDRGRKVAGLYNAGGPIVRRTVYLIGKDGQIRFARRGKPTPDEVLQSAE
jgi:thioredoxin-dependent peroxiredoxin